MNSAPTILPLETVARASAVTPGNVASGIPSGLAGRVARCAHEVLVRTVPVTARPAILVDAPDGTVRIDREEGDGCSPVLDGAAEILRARGGWRLAASGSRPVFLNGWPVRRDAPVLLAHGDVVRCDAGLIALRLDPPVRPVVEAGDACPAAPPSDIGAGFRFSIEPSGEPLEVRCDGTVLRALAGKILGRDRGRPFDPTVLDPIELATLDWLAHRIADGVAADVFGSTVALRPSTNGTEPDVWACSAVRIGPARGAVWIGTTERGRGELARTSAPVVHAQRRRNPALVGIHVTASAQIPLGRVTSVEAAALVPGDILVNRGVAALDAGSWSSPGRVCIAGADGLSARAVLSLDEDGQLIASVDRCESQSGEVPMNVPRESPPDLEPAHPFDGALDAIEVVVTAEIARRRLRLSDLLGLTSGDILAFPSPVGADVSLVIDGTAFARGVLVDVEGSLGVRVVSTGGHR